MPKPAPNEHYENTQWTVVQRFADWDRELRPIAEAIVNLDGQPIATNKAKILSCLNAPDPEGQWSGYWVSVIQQLGLMILQDPDTNVVEPTKLCKAVVGGISESTFYRIWSLGFQFPYAMNKQTDWYTSGRAIQPCVVLFKTLQEMYRERVINKPLGPTPVEVGLSSEEVVWFLFDGPDRNSAYELIRERCRSIFNARSANHFPAKFDGFESAAQQVASRVFRLIAQTGLVERIGDRIRVDVQQLSRIYQLLSFAQHPIIPSSNRAEYRLALKQRFDLLASLADQVSLI